MREAIDVPFVVPPGLRRVGRNGQPTMIAATSTREAAISAINAISSFHQLSIPHVRVQSGHHVRLNVGEQVPTLSSVVYEGSSGTPVQSVTYQDAGLIFDVTPMLVGDDVYVLVDEEISGFVATTTGVKGSPTKNTRQMQTLKRMADSEVIVGRPFARQQHERVQLLSVVTVHSGWQKLGQGLNADPAGFAGVEGLKRRGAETRQAAA